MTPLEKKSEKIRKRKRDKEVHESSAEEKYQTVFGHTVVKPRVGDLFTEHVGSDTYGREVVKVTTNRKGKVVAFEARSYVTGPPDRPERRFVLKRSGVWVDEEFWRGRCAPRLSFGEAITNLDPGF